MNSKDSCSTTASFGSANCRIDYSGTRNTLARGTRLHEANICDHGIVGVSTAKGIEHMKDGK
jgi:hypothetical protein